MVSSPIIPEDNLYTYENKPVLSPCDKPAETAYVGTSFESYRTERLRYYVGHHLGPKVFADECFNWMALQDIAAQKSSPDDEEVCAYMYDTLHDIAKMQYLNDEPATACDSTVTHIHMAHTLAISKLASVLMHHEYGLMRINYDMRNVHVTGIHLSADTSVGAYVVGQDTASPLYFESRDLYVQATTPAVLQPYEVTDIAANGESFDAGQFVTLTPRVKAKAWSQGYIGHNAAWN